MPYARALSRGQLCRILVHNIDTRKSSVVHVSTERLYEAPNWTRDGQLILNGDGFLWSVSPVGGIPQRIELPDVPELNNDHVLAPDGMSVYLSANDWHIYRAPLAGGPAERVTPEDRVLHFLHGVSPDNSELAYVGLQPDSEKTWSSGTIWTIPASGGKGTQITFDGPDDGPEYSPDGRWIYFNTEAFSETPGHAQIARIPAGGGQSEQLTFDERVNWFPHLSPNGTKAYYVSFPAGTEGHPEDLPVELRVVDVADWTTPKQTIPLFGGQGTANVNGWDPTGTRFAYVDYPIAPEAISL